MNKQWKKSKMKNLIKEKGITLIALVVTIIVLLILAGITIGLVLGQNGIIGKAKKAIIETKESSEKEEDNLIEMEKNINSYTYSEPWTGKIDTNWYTKENDTITEFTIITPEELAGLAQLVNSGNSFENKIIKLGKSLDLASLEWLPIGTSENPFKGTIDGQTYSIKNVYMSNGNNNQGLVGILSSEGKIKNIFISDGNISGGKMVGGIVGKSYGNIENCSFKGKVSGYSAIGGISGGVSEGNVSNCINYGEIKARYQQAAGIVGKVEGSCCITKCSNFGNIYSEAGGNNFGRFSGGIIAWVYSENIDLKVEECINNGNINGVQQVGGIIGSIGYGKVNYTGRILKCINNGNVEGNVYVGGIVGCLNSYRIEVNGCHNNQKIVEKAKYGGGIVGYSCGIVRYCSNNAPIQAVDFAGGIVGYNIGGTVEYTFNGHEVNAEMDTIGGIVGENLNSGIVRYSYNRGNIGAKEGATVGGIVGNNNTETHVEVTKCYYLKNVAGGGINNNDVSGSAESINEDIKSYSEFLHWIKE